MNIFDELFSKGLIKKNKLLIAYHHQLGLTLEQTFLLIRLIEFQLDNNFFEINMFFEENKSDFSKEDIEMFLSYLYERKYITLEIKNQIMNLSFVQLWNHVTNWFDFYDIDWELNQKINWFIFNFRVPSDFDLKFLEKLIINNEDFIVQWLRKNPSKNWSFEILIKRINLALSKPKEIKVVEKKSFSNDLIESNKLKDNSTTIDNLLQVDFDEFENEDLFIEDSIPSKSNNKISKKLIQKSWSKE